MRISELANCPHWLSDADTFEADVEWSPYGTIRWNSGEFRGGEFRGGAFRGGAFWGGEFLGGTFLGGEFRGGAFWGGEFLGGTFLGGAFRGGAFRGGAFRGGEFLGGEFWGGEFWGEKLTRNPRSVYGLRWPVVISEKQMQIGCERHTIEEWAAFDDARIVQMDRGALKFWRQHKAGLMALCASDKGDCDDL